MSYISLYRKWRPQVFENVVEQEHVVRTLRNSIISNRIAHAYLFCGTRGTGKTSMAHIFSRAINCLSPVNGDPCNTCEICKGILDGSILDVIEIDAASNNSVDNIREIRDEVVYAPSQAKYKVYIIDEVHMLSSGAFNALLKTLEEPPPHVVFILATTEPHKLPATILSRCQRFEFRRITPESIAERLNRIAQANAVTLEDGAAELIARLSDGALRDAISILDQCMALGNSSINYNDVLNVAGIVNDTFIADMVDSIIVKDAGSLLLAVDKLIAQGKDIAKFAGDLILYFRNLLICKVSDSPGKLMELPQDAVDRMKTQASSFDQNLLINIIKELSANEAALKWAVHPRILLEAMLIKLCEGNLIADKEDIMARLARLENMTAGLENMVASGSFMAATSTGAVRSLDNTSEPAGMGKLEQTRTQSLNHGVVGKPTNMGNQTLGQKPTPQDPGLGKKGAGLEALHSKELAEWKLIVGDIKSSGRMALYPNLLGTKAVELDNNTVAVIFSAGNGFCRMFSSKAENQEVLEAAVSKRLGRAVRVKCIDEESFIEAAEKKTEEKDEVEEKLWGLAKKHNIPFDIIDE